jgi:hypothetical protein
VFQKPTPTQSASAGNMTCNPLRFYRLDSELCDPSFLVVPMEGVEPTHPYGYQILSLIIQGVSQPKLRIVLFLFYFWTLQRDLRAYSRTQPIIKDDYETSHRLSIQKG